MSPEIQKRSELLKLVVQNTKLNGKKVEYTLNTPFLEIAERAKCSEWLPSPEIIRTAIGKVILAFQDTVQVELVRVRFEEIKKLQPTSLAIA